ncbi:MAG: hypothetical protein WB679_25885 [Terracidiphilus sp.]
MEDRRPVGVKLIAAFFFLKAAAIILALIVAHIYPGYRASAQEFIGQLAPLLQGQHTDLGMLIAPFFSLLGIVIGLGVWFTKQWARTLLILDTGIPLGRLAIALVTITALDRKLFALLPSSAYFLIDVFSSILILGYLLDPNARRAFRVES